MTVQIPFDIVTICSVCTVTLPSEYAPTVLWVSEDGINSAVFQLMALSDQVHVLTSCDTFLTAVPPPINYTGLPCSPMVTHFDGSLVSFRQSGATRRGNCGLCRRPRQHQSRSGGRPTGVPRPRPPAPPSTCNSSTCRTRCRRVPAGAMRRCSPGLPRDTTVCIRSIWWFPLLQRAHLRAAQWTRANYSRAATWCSPI